MYDAHKTPPSATKKTGKVSSQYKVAPYARKHEDFNEKTYKTFKEHGLSGVMAWAFVAWQGRRDSSGKDYGLSPHQFAEWAGVSLQYAYRVLRQAEKAGLVECVRKGSRSRRSASEFHLTDKVCKWGQEPQSLEKYSSRLNKRLITVVPSELKEGEPLTPTTDQESGPEPIQPPETAGDVFEHVNEEITIPEYVTEDFQESEQQINQIVVDLMQEGCSRQGAAKAAKKAFADGRLEQAHRDLLQAKAWVPTAPWVQRKAGYLCAIVANEKNAIRFRENLKPKAPRNRKAAVPVPLLGHDRLKAAKTAWDNAERTIPLPDSPGYPDATDKAGRLKAEYLGLALDALGPAGGRLVVEIEESLIQAGMPRGEVTFTRARKYHLGLRVLALVKEQGIL